MYSVSDGSCGFVTEQSKPLGSKKGAAATVAFGILKFLLFVHCLYHLYMYCVPNAVPNSQS